jgi:hypothetical protein
MRTWVTLARNCAAEWSRLWTVRSTWLFALATAVVVLGLATIAGYSFSGDAEPDGSPWKIGQFLGMLALFGVLVIAAVTATADHATGGIVPTLQWTPRRPILLAARAGVIVVTTTALGLLLVAGASIVIWLFASHLDLIAAQGARTLGRAFVVYAAGALLSVGIGLATRSTAGTLVSVFALMLVLPLLLQAFPFDWIVHIIEALPGSGALFLMAGEGPGDTRMTTTWSALTLAAWASVALAAGGWRVLHADVDV